MWQTAGVRENIVCALPVAMVVCED